MKNLNIVAKSNNLIEAQYKLSLNEQRLIILLSSVIQPYDDDFHDYDLRVTEFAIMFDIQSVKNIHALVEEAAKSLVGKRLDLSRGKEKEYVAWLSHAKYIEGKGIINISFDKSLKPYLLQLKSHFTQYRLLYVIKFKSSYSIRLYEILKSYEFLGNGGVFYCEFSLLELKYLFCVEKGEYEIFGNFKNRMISPSIKEINQHSDIFVSSVEYIKEGRAVKRIKFIAEPKANKVLEHQPSNSKATLSEDVTVLMGLGISEETAEKWAKKHGKENVLKACGFVRAKQATGEVKNVPAYLAKALKDGYYMAWVDEEGKKEAKRSTENARKAQKEEGERKARENMRQRIDAALEAFHARPEIEQVDMRTVFGSKVDPIMAKMWKKSVATDPQPENDVRFRFEFANFVQSYEPS